MALPDSQRDELLALCIAMFKAAPGDNYLDQLVSAREAGSSLLDIANALATKPLFQLVYPSYLTPYDLAERIVGNLLASDTPEGARSWATNWAHEKLYAGASIASVLLEAAQALTSTDNPNYASAKALMANRIDVARYYSVTQEQSSMDLVTLQNVLAGVTSAPASVAAAKAAVDDNLGGSEFALTAGADDFMGTAGNDRFVAGVHATVFTESDKLDGGAGLDTLTLYTTPAINDAFPNGATLSNIEIINLYRTAGNHGAVDASKFSGASVINQIAGASQIINLGAGMIAGFKDLDGVLSVAAATDASSATIALDNVAAITLRIAASDSGILDTVTVSGALAPHSASEYLFLEISPGADVETLTLDTAVDVALTLYGLGMKPVSTIDAAGATGKIRYDTSTSLTDIRTGAGNDELYLRTAFNSTVEHASMSGGGGDDKLTVNVDNSAKVDASVSVDAGAGNDLINIEIWTAPITVDLNAGLGNDTVALPSVSDTVTAASSIDGGAGIDSLWLSGRELTSADYSFLASAIKNFEIIKLDNASVDASRLANYKSFESVGGNDTAIVNLADDQQVTTQFGVKAIAAGYQAGTATDPAVYAGTLDITISPPAPTVSGGTTRVYADTVNLSVKALTDNNGVSHAPGGGLAGDVKIAHVTLVSAIDNAGTPATTADDVYEIPWFNLNASPYIPDSLDALTTLTLSGNGHADVVNRSQNLTTIDASGLDIRDIDGMPVLGLRALVLFSDNSAAETVKLSGSGDRLHIANSTVANTDTLYGFTLVDDAGLAGKQVDLDRSDQLQLGTNDGATTLKGGFTQATVSAGSLDQALADLAASTNDKVAFHFGGNTYVYGDLTASGSPGNGTVDATDILVRLVGVLDLDLLVEML